jgi:multiple sugar transport system substrate-binding protein
MKRTRVVAAFAATLITMGGLTACSAGDSGGGDGSDGPVTISIMEIKETNINAIRKVIPGFEAEMKKQGKDISVKLIADQLTDEQFVTKMTQQLIAGQAPDILDLGDPMVTSWASAGYLEPLDDYLAKWDDWDRFYPSVKDAALRQDGKTYNVPSGAGVQSFFYRKDLLEKAGIDTSQPATWDDMIDRLTEIKDKIGGVAPIVIPAGSAWGGGTWGEGFHPILGGATASYYDADSGKWNLDDASWKKVFDLYAELTQKDLLPIKDLQNPNPWEPTKYTDFPEGKIQVSAQGTWGWRFDWGPEGAAPIDDLTERVDTWQYPALDAGGETYGWASSGGGYAIPAKSENKDAAMLFMEYLTTGKVLADQLVASGAVSPRDDLNDVAPYSQEEKLLEAAEDLKSGVTRKTGDGTDQVAQAVATATELILSGKANGQQAYDAFKKDATDLLGPNLVQE